MTTQAYLDYGGANEVLIDWDNTKITQRPRWVTTYKAGTSHGVHQDMGHADRVFNVEGGLITITEIGRLKTLAEGAAAVNFRAAATNNADVTVIIEDYMVGRDVAIGRFSASDTTHVWQVRLVLRESA